MPRFRLSLCLVALTVALGATAAPASATPPTSATTLPASAITYNGATLNGKVDPGGQPSSGYGFYYGRADSAFCTNHSAGSGTFTGNTALPSDTGEQSVSKTLTGLTPNTAYCFQLFAYNSTGGTNYVFGGFETFTTLLSNPPSVTTTTANPITGKRATLNGTVNPNGQSTQYKVAYSDPGHGDWCASHGSSGTPTYVSSPTTLPDTDNTPHDVSVPVSGLRPKGQYCYQVQASSDGGAAVGDVVPFTAGDLVTSLGPASSVTNHSAAFAGKINPDGENVSYSFAVDKMGSSFCTSGAVDPYHAPESSALTPLSDNNNSDHPVSATIAGLRPRTSYCARLVLRYGPEAVPGYGPSERSVSSPTSFTTARPWRLTINFDRYRVGDRFGRYDRIGVSRDESGGSAFCAGSASTPLHSTCSFDGVPGDGGDFGQGDVVYLGWEVQDENSQFAGWSGCPEVTDKGYGCRVTMNGDVTISARDANCVRSGGGESGASGSNACGSGAGSAAAAIGKAITPSGPASKIGAILKTGAYPAALNAPSAGTAQILWYQVPAGAHIARAKKPVLVASGTKTLTKSGKVTIKVKLSGKGKAILKKTKKGHKLKLTGKGSFTPTGGKKTTKLKAFSLKR